MPKEKDIETKRIVTCQVILVDNQISGIFIKPMVLKIQRTKELNYHYGLWSKETDFWNPKSKNSDINMKGSTDLLIQSNIRINGKIEISVNKKTVTIANICNFWESGRPFIETKSRSDFIKILYTHHSKLLFILFFPSSLRLLLHNFIHVGNLSPVAFVNIILLFLLVIGFESRI